MLVTPPFGAVVGVTVGVAVTVFVGLGVAVFALVPTCTIALLHAPGVDTAGLQLITSSYPSLYTFTPDGENVPAPSIAE
jgi:hypothetical protein